MITEYAETQRDTLPSFEPLRQAVTNRSDNGDVVPTYVTGAKVSAAQAHTISANAWYIW